MSTSEDKIEKLTELVEKQQALIDALPTWLDMFAVFGILIAMLIGVYWVFNTLKLREQGFGPNSLKALGIVLFIPSLVLLALLTDFKTETLAALLGTVAGYVLSNTEDKSK
ncbi:hypothetical protein [Shewanella algae]|uniref:hypothetical protein n=1 Tax=Shewanella algae TaxID=38313 RepID=UPI0031F4C742